MGISEFMVKVEVIDADGNVPFTLSVPASKEDLFLPEHVTPGIAKVLAHLEKATS
jgi:hypothetical protein